MSARPPGYRLAYNVYNSGIAALTVAGLLKGILDIAGAASAYTIMFQTAGWVLSGAGIILLLAKARHRITSH